MNVILRKFAHLFDYEIMPRAEATRLAARVAYAEEIPYITPKQEEIIRRSSSFTQTARDSLFGLVRAVEHVVKAGISGVFAECGVWKGGSVMAIALTLDSLGVAGSDIFLFDTFRGMPPGGKLDVDASGNDEKWYREKSDQYSHTGVGDQWNAVTLETVRRNIDSIGSRQNFHYIEGPVEETLPANAPDQICLLRLDTDFYSSTRHEMTHLYPRLSSGGLLIVDDYGHFLGARQAVDEYLEQQQIKLLFHRLNYSVVIAVKP